MSFDKRDRLGPGQIAAERPVVFRCAWPGKEQLFIGNFMISSKANESEMRAEAEKVLADFAKRHFPDGYPLPEIIAIEPGAFRWIPDNEYWRRGR